jgi:hypothetical protein
MLMRNKAEKRFTKYSRIVLETISAISGSFAVCLAGAIIAMSVIAASAAAQESVGQEAKGAVTVSMKGVGGAAVKGATVQIILPSSGRTVPGQDAFLTVVDGADGAVADGTAVFTADMFSGKIKDGGKFEVSVFAKGYKDYSGSYAYKSGIDNEIEIKLTPGADTELPQPKPGDIVVSITNSKGEPLPGALVKAYFPGANGSLDRLPNILFEMTEGDKKYDADGKANGLFHFKMDLFKTYIKDGQEFLTKLEFKGLEFKEGPIKYGEKHVNKISIQTK